MDVNERIEEFTTDLFYGGIGVGREAVAEKLRALVRDVLEASRKHLCRLCSDGDEPKQGMHNTVVGFVMCVPWPLRALLPPETR